MTAMQSLLQAGPEAGEALLGLMSQCCDLREFGAEVMRLALNALMSAEADALCGAARGERSESRVNSRNGYRQRSLKTPVGDLELDVPKLRRGTYYPESVLSRWSRVEASLAALVVEAYVNGVSTRDMSLLAESLGVSSLSASEVSRLTSELDAQVSELRGRRLDDQRYCYLWVDATYVRCRVAGRSVSQAVVTAIALGEDGRKRLVGLDCVDTESYADWRAFLASVRARGLSGLVMCVSDAHAGLVRALSEVFQGAAWQRCTVHLQRDVSRAVRRGAPSRSCASSPRPCSPSATSSWPAPSTPGPSTRRAPPARGPPPTCSSRPGRTPSSTCRRRPGTGGACAPTTSRRGPTGR